KSTRYDQTLHAECRDGGCRHRRNCCHWFYSTLLIRRSSRMSSISRALERTKRQRAQAAGAPARPNVDGQSARDDKLLRMDRIPELAPNWDALKAHRILTENTHSPAESAYRMIRTRVMRKLRSNGWRFVGVS